MSVLGTGWTFPPTFDKASNGVAMSSDLANVESSIYLILHTKFGERIMRRNFGSNIYDLVFEPLTTTMKTYMASTLKASLEDNEPRITVENLRLEQPDPNLGRVDIHIDFTLIETSTPQNLVLPFYVPEDIR